jgi:hypothetical protein
MNGRTASRAVSQSATPKNCAASCGVFIIPPTAFRPRDGESGKKSSPGIAGVRENRSWQNAPEVVPVRGKLLYLKNSLF